jgi:hypothetical protein
MQRERYYYPSKANRQRALSAASRFEQFREIRGRHAPAEILTLDFVLI